MKRSYESPTLSVMSMQSEAIMTASEEAFDINVSFDALWGANT